MEELVATRKCEHCGAEAPVTQTGYTLIGGKHAWRCAKVRNDDEQSTKLLWYCPDCWKKKSRLHTKV
jgi:hypothetical protein